ncbi:hypothetical protein EV641_10643 [Rhodococcus sp. SMB37]|uniref:hypothetical protein n=1 Tax=Rhodococcus sp. SMB37 TaxID=2512213 RepID=UPI0010E17BE3|nr:hypothetical protein [Rhodococcus sp. SMB37]TCN53399.1 hypothetical protein EV641_10643 [Rhodococcus sp. SMB37]
MLTGRATARAKDADGPVEMTRMLKLAKASSIKARTQSINQLKAVLVAADTELREALSGLSSTVLFRRCAELEAHTPHDVTTAATYTLRLLARRILELSTEIRDLERRITDVIAEHAPKLLERRGVGPDSAAALLITAGDNPDRCAARRPLPPCAASIQSTHPPARPHVAASTEVEIDRPTPRCTASSCPVCVGMPRPAPTWHGASRRARPGGR